MGYFRIVYGLLLVRLRLDSVFIVLRTYEAFLFVTYRVAIFFILRRCGLVNYMIIQTVANLHISSYSSC